MLSAKKFLVVSGLVGISLVFGCSNDPEAKDSLSTYRQHIKSAQIDLDSETTSTDSNNVSKLHQRMEGHLDEMAEIRRMMSNACVNLADCDEGGGATGDMDHGCMHGGRMLSADDMDHLQQGEENMREMMQAFSDQCENAPTQCETGYEKHNHQMGTLLTDMLDNCDEMMERQFDMNQGDHVGMCGMH